MVVAQMETASFSWVALGNNEADASKAMLDGWNKHAAECNRHGANVQLYKNVKRLEDEYGITYIKLNPGECEWW